MFRYLKKIVNRFIEPPLLDSFDEHSRKMKKRTICVITFFILLICFVTFGSTYAIFTSIKKSDNYNVIKTGNLCIEFDDSTGLGDTIKLNGAYPISDDEGLQTLPYKFKVTNKGTLPSIYKISILDDQDMINEDCCSDMLLSKASIKVSLNGGTPYLLSSKEASNYIIEENSLNAGEDRIYTIQIWIDSEVGNEVLGRHFHGKIKVVAVNA